MKMAFYAALMILLPGSAAISFERTSLVSIIVAPEKFIGKEIDVRGYLVLEFENMRLYLTSEHARVHDSTSALWVEGVPEAWQNALKPEGEWVVLEGKLTPNRNGYSAFGVATITVATLQTKEKMFPPLEEQLRQVPAIIKKLLEQEERRVEQEKKRLEQERNK